LKREDIHRVVTLGSYPLHPMTAFCLPKISQKVAQNERTLFTFLSDSGSDTLGPFLHTTDLPQLGGYPPLVSVDKLWNFFAQDVERDPFHARIFKKFIQADTLIEPDDILSKRIMKAIALLQVIASDRARCDEQVIAFSLGLRISEYGMLREKLKSLCNKEVNRERILIQSVTDGAYRFTGFTSDNFEEKVEQIVRERMNIIKPVDHLMEITQSLKIDCNIHATGYSDDFMIERKLKLVFVDLYGLQRSDRWLKNLGEGEYRDGYALIVLCEDSNEIRKAKEILIKSLNHPQILIAVPKEPVFISNFLRKHEAICYLETVQANLYGEGAELRDEWKQQYDDYLLAIEKIIIPLRNPEKRLLDWFVNGKEMPNIISNSKLSTLASDMMREVFPLTPKITHERLTSDEGKDTFKKSRQEIIDKLLQRDGAEQLAKETNTQYKTVIDFVYKKNGILIQGKDGKFIITEPDEKKYPAINAVWKEIANVIKDAKKSSFLMAKLINKLRKPPYGMRQRSISLILAAVFNPYILRGNLSFELSKSRSGINRINKIIGDVLDDTVFSSDKYSLVYINISQNQENILFGMADAFGINISAGIDKGGLIDIIHEEIMKWWRGLSQFSQKTKKLSKEALGIRKTILWPLSYQEADAYKILLEIIPSRLQTKEGKDIIEQKLIAKIFNEVKKEIENAVERYLIPEVKNVISEVFSGVTKDKCDGITEIGDWFKKLTKEQQEIRVSGDSLELSKIAQDIANGSENKKLELELSKKITGMPLDNWNDENISVFKGRLEGVKKTVEEYQPPVKPPDKNGGEVVGTQIFIRSKDLSFTRTFVPVDNISPMGDTLRNIIRNAVEGIGRTLPAGEYETILIEIMKDTLK